MSPRTVAWNLTPSSTATSAPASTVPGVVLPLQIVQGQAPPAGAVTVTDVPAPGTSMFALSS